MSFLVQEPQSQYADNTNASKNPEHGHHSQSRSGLHLSNIISHVLLIGASLCAIFPVYWLFATSFRPGAAALRATPLPWPFGFENYEAVLTQIPIVSMLWNTLWMSSVMALAQLLVAILASYGFAMWDFPGKNALFFLFVASWLVPFQVTMIPNYVLISQLGLLGSVMGIVLPNLCSAFAVLMMRQHMNAFPKELIEAAKLDGRGSFSTLWSVVVPNMRAALAALGIVLFLEAWNNYLWPSLVMQKQTGVVLQIGIRSFMGAEGNNWGAIMAASAIACLPVFIVYVFLSRHIQDAFVRSGLR